MKNATRLSPELIERLQESAQVDEGVESYEARDLNTKRGVISLPTADSDRVSICVSTSVFEWFSRNAHPDDSAESTIDRVLREHITRELKKAG